MSETRFHGARVKENTDLVTAINDIDSSVIGIVKQARIDHPRGECAG